MSGTITGLEGILANRILAGPADEPELEEHSSARIEADTAVYKRALGGTWARRGRRVVVTTTAKDQGTSTQILTSGSVVMGACISAAELAVTRAAMEQVAGGTPAIRYLEAMQGHVCTAQLTQEWAALHALAIQKLDWATVNSVLQNTVSPFLGASDKKSSPVSGWLDEVRQELVETLEEDASLDTAKQKILYDFASDALEHAAKVGVDAPSIDLGNHGDLHLFWKKANEGLLVVIRTDRTIHFFGNSDGESFRGDYPLVGKKWRSHLSFYLQPLRSDATA